MVCQPRHKRMRSPDLHKAVVLWRRRCLRRRKLTSHTGSAGRRWLCVCCRNGSPGQSWSPQWGHLTQSCHGHKSGQIAGTPLEKWPGSQMTWVQAEGWELARSGSMVFISFLLVSTSWSTHWQDLLNSVSTNRNLCSLLSKYNHWLLTYLLTFNRQWLAFS